MTKRVFDILVSAAGLITLSPIFVIVAVLIKATDGGSILYRQQRVGQFGRIFWILKFRSMREVAVGPQSLITAAGDPRITRIGAFIRKWKLDELPQLVNVLKGDMSLVGPRPEVPKYVAFYSEEQKLTLEYRPGITDVATIEFRNEEEMLASAVDREAFYRQYCLPTKARLNLEYAKQASFWGDVMVILRTIAAIFSSKKPRTLL